MAHQGTCELRFRMSGEGLLGSGARWQLAAQAAPRVTSSASREWDPTSLRLNLVFYSTASARAEFRCFLTSATDHTLLDHY